MGQVTKGKIVAYNTAVNVPVRMVLPGEHSVAAAFRTAHYSYKLNTWIVRFGAYLLLYFAVTCTSKLLHLLCKYFFFRADEHFFFTKFIFLVAQNSILWTIVAPNQGVSGNLLLSLSIALIITSFAWVFQRPYLACSMIVAAVSPFLYFARGFMQYHRI